MTALRESAGASIRWLRELLPEWRLIHASAMLFFGSAAARFLGFLFPVTAAHLLLPADFGLLAYALVIANIAAVLITNAPAGLARFVARHHGDRREQDAHFSNWLMIVAAMLAVSLVLVIPVALIAGLAGWMLVGIVANLVGLAVLYSYKETQRGLERFASMVVFGIAGNAIQLVAIVVLAALGWRSAALFLAVYGLSFMAPLLVMEPIAPIALSFVRETINWQRMVAIARFIRPAVLQTAFFTVWFGTDLILVERLLTSEAAGNYAAAKTLSYVAYMAPGALASPLISRVARLSERTLRKDLVRVLTLGLLVSVPVLATLMIIGRTITELVFGSKYPHAAEPLSVLALGMGLYGLYLILESTWLGLGRPQIDAVATAAAMVCTVVLGLILVPQTGLVGAAIAFTSGSALQLAVIGGFTVWALYLGETARIGHLKETEFGVHVSSKS